MVMEKKVDNPKLSNQGASVSVSNCTFQAVAAATSEHQSKALEMLAAASAEHAKSIAEIAKSLRGAEAHMGTGLTVQTQPIPA